MTLTIEIPDEKTAALAARAKAQGLSSEQYARKLLEHDLEVGTNQTLRISRITGVASRCEGFASPPNLRRCPLSRDLWMRTFWFTQWTDCATICCVPRVARRSPRTSRNSPLCNIRDSLRILLSCHLPAPCDTYTIFRRRRASHQWPTYFPAGASNTRPRCGSVD